MTAAEKQKSTPKRCAFLLFGLPTGLAGRSRVVAVLEPEAVVAKRFQVGVAGRFLGQACVFGDSAAELCLGGLQVAFVGGDHGAEVIGIGRGILGDGFLRGGIVVVERAGNGGVIPLELAEIGRASCRERV